MKTILVHLLFLLPVGQPPASTTPPDAPTAPHRAVDFRGVVQHAKERVFPAVVFIKCISETHERGKKAAKGVSGSGVIVSPEGQVITNWHVVDKAVEVRCLLLDGRACTATVLGTDKDTDLALLQLDEIGDEPLPSTTLGDSAALREGDFVMAMGAPWGMSRSVSIGIVSCTRRFLPGNSEYSLWIQTDAAISPGNSGGPLVNTDGLVVGINTRGIMFGGDMGFAVPSVTVRRVIDQIREHGEVRWSWTGLQLQPLRDFNRNIYFDVSEGVIVAGTDPESPARRAGIMPQDRIVSIDNTPVTAVTEEGLPAVRRMLGGLPEGVAVSIELIRDGAAVQIDMTPRAKGETEGDELDCPRWDLTAKSINQFDNPSLYFYRKKGVFVFGVRHPGNATVAGLQAKDIIIKIDGQAIVTLDDLKAAHETAIKNIDSRSRLVLMVLRGGLMRQIVLDFSRDYEKR